MRIQPIFFPFSHIRKDQVETLTRFFPRLAFLPLESRIDADHSLRPWVRGNRLDPVLTSPDHLSRVTAAVASFQAWAWLHQGNEQSMKALIQTPAHTDDDTRVTRIKSQLQQGLGRVEKKVDHPGAGSREDPLLFLKFAQTLDLENEIIDDALTGVAQEQAALFSELKGEEPSGFPGNAGSASFVDPGQLFTAERIRAWLWYASEKGLLNPGDSTPLLVTTSTAVLDCLESESGDMINALDIKSIKVHENNCVNQHPWQQAFEAQVGRWVAQDQFSRIDLEKIQDGCKREGQVFLRCFPQDSIKGFLEMPDRPLAVCQVKLKS